MSPRKLILVTGAPRTATTPVGNMLSTARRTVSLYEPVGPTGVRKIEGRFPMLSSTFDEDDLSELMEDFRNLRFGFLKSQQRGRNTFSWRRAIFGGRTNASLRLAQLQPWSSNLIWKDPHAIFLAPDVARLGVDVVVTIRRAMAHAGSYARLGWRSRAAEIYPIWAKRFGTCPILEAALPDSNDPVISSALIWRLSYLGLLRAGAMSSVRFVTSDALMQNERQTYSSLFDHLGLVPTRKTEFELARIKTDTSVAPKSGKVHDWNRSAASANSYWQGLLSIDDKRRVEKITRDVEDALFDGISN